MLHNFLGFDVIVPEVGIVGFGLEFGYFGVFFFYFKDTPGDLSRGY